MQVENVLVDEILVDEANRVGLVKSTLYEFKEPKWVSIHREREGRRLGPMTLLDEPQDRDEVFNVSIRSFEDRQLHTEGKPGRLVVSYRDRWTVPPWTVYALVLPKCFVTTHINLSRREQAGWEPQLQLGVSHDERLFYHTVFEWAESRHIFDIEARIEQDVGRYRRLLKSAEVVRGTSNYEHLRGAIGRKATSSDFWFKLLELGGKLLGMP
jgi:hypothetical protein